MTLHRKIYKNVRASIFLMYNGKVTCFTSYKNERRDLSNTIFINHINIGKAATSIGLLSNELSNYEWDGTDYLLEIHTDKIGLLDMDKIEELYEIGYKTAKKQIKEIIKKVDR